MKHGQSKAVAAGRRGNSRFLCTIVKYGPAVGVVIFSLLSLWAIITIYRSMTRGKKNKKFGSERKEISTEGHAPRDSKLTENSDDCVEDCRADAGLPGESQNFSPRATTMDQCFESCLQKEQEENTAQLNATNQTESPIVHSDLSTISKYCMGGQQELKSSSNDYCHNDRPDPSGQLTGGYFGDTKTDSSSEETKMAIGTLVSGCNVVVQENLMLPEMDTEVHNEYPNGHHYHEHECLSIHMNDDSGARSVTSDKNEGLKTESNVMGQVCNKTMDENVTEGILESSQRFVAVTTEAGEHQHEGHLHKMNLKGLDKNCTFPERYVEEQGDAEPAKRSLKETRCQSSLDGDPMGKRVLVVPPMPQMVAVQFRVHYITSSPSQQLAVTGSLPELGNWSSFVELCQSPDGFWVNTVALSADSQAEWKFVLVEGGKILRWEECANRHLEIGSERDLLLHEAWGFP